MVLKYHEKPVQDWNVKNFTDYLVDTTREKFGVTYAPMGKGSLQQRWAVERGQLKNMISKHGAEVVKAFIDYCINEYTPTKAYPYINFGFMYSYRTSDIARAELSMKRAEARKAAKKETKEVGEDWF